MADLLFRATESPERCEIEARADAFERLMVEQRHRVVGLWVAIMAGLVALAMALGGCCIEQQRIEWYHDHCGRCTMVIYDWSIKVIPNVECPAADAGLGGAK